MKRYSLALDLKDDPLLIKEYKEYHKKVWPEVTNSITDAGIINLEIYLTGNRLFMIMETDDMFSLAKKNKMDIENTKVQEWETLMWKYQKALPLSKDGEKWRVMDLIYSLNN